MTTYTRADAWVWLGGYRLSAWTLDMTTPEVVSGFEVADTFGDSWQEQLPNGLKQWAASMNLIYDDAALGPTVALDSFVGSGDRVICWGPAGATPGVLCEFGSCDQVNWWPSIKRAAFTKAKVDLGGDGPLYHGVLLMKDTAAGATLNGTGVNDVAAATTNGAAAAMQILSTNGTLTLKVQHSTDNSTYADLITFTAKASGAVPYSEVKTVAGTVNKWLRANVANSGGTTAEVVVAAARL